MFRRKREPAQSWQFDPAAIESILARGRQYTITIKVATDDDGVRYHWNIASGFYGSHLGQGYSDTRDAAREAAEEFCKLYYTETYVFEV